VLPVATDEDERAAVPAAVKPEACGPSLRSWRNRSRRLWRLLRSRLTPHAWSIDHSRYLGLMLFYPMLQVVGLLELAAQAYQLAGVVRFGVQHVFTELFCLGLLQEPNC
jgi:hypothetical protein